MRIKATLNSTAKNNLLANIAIIIYIGLFLYIYRYWLFDIYGIISHGDWPYFTNGTLMESRRYYFSTWMNDFGFGRVLYDLVQAPTYSLYGYLHQILGFEYSVLERIIHLWPTLALSVAGTFIFLRSQFKNRLAIIAGLFVFSFNTYMLVLQSGHITLAASLSLFPIILYAYFRAIDSEKYNLPFISLTTILLLLSGAYEFRLTYIYIAVLSLYVLILLFNSELIRRDKWIKSLSLMSILVLFLLGNFYWILPLSSLGTISDNEIFSRGLFGSEYIDILHAISAHHPFWGPYGIAEEIFVKHRLNIFQWIIPSVVLFSFTIKKTPKLTYFMLIYIIGVFLVKISNPPFGDMYRMAYDYIPGFNAYRESTKFFAMVVISLTFIIPYVIDHLFSVKKSVYGSIVAVAIIVWAISNASPFLKNPNQSGTFISKNNPAEYKRLEEIIENDNSYSRTLWIPTDSRWGTYNKYHPRVTLSDLQSRTREIIRLRDISILEKPEMFNPIIDILSIKYILIPTVDQNDDFYIFYKDRGYYEKYVKAFDYLEAMNDPELGDLQVYVNHDYHPFLYITDEELRLRNQDIRQVGFEYENPTRITISIDNLTGQKYLNFSEDYHPNWELYINGTYPVGNEFHQRNTAGMNSYKLDAEWVASNIPASEYTLNPDGSISMTAILYFTTQDKLNHGITISLVTLSLLVFSIIISSLISKPDK